MKISAFVGSPNRDGNTATLVKAMCEAASRNGHETRIFHLYDLKIAGCRDCGHCKTESEDCILPDDFQMCRKEIIASEGIILASPVYFGQITGTLKSFIDRWCCFFSPAFAIRQLQGKKFATVTASGAPTEQFRNVSEYLNYWMGEFFKMKLVGNVIGGSLVKHTLAGTRQDLLDEAARIGSLF